MGELGNTETKWRTHVLKQLLVTTALTGLLVGSAAAQNAPANNPPSTPPSQAQSRAGGSPQFVTSQKSDEFLASKFKGTDVIGADNKQIGDVSDVLFDKNGQIKAFIVSVGGFLGVGSKDIAIAPSSFQVVAGDKSKNESDKLK